MPTVNANGTQEAATERVVRQHCHNGGNIAAAGRPDRDAQTTAHDVLE